MSMQVADLIFSPPMESQLEVNAKGPGVLTALHVISSGAGYANDLLEMDNRSMQLLSHLLRLGADCENLTDDQETPVHLAGWFDRADVAQCLLDYQANTNKKLQNGDSSGRLNFSATLQ